MGLREDKYDLDGIVEVDDAFFNAHSDDKIEGKTKRGRGKSTTK